MYAKTNTLFQSKLSKRAKMCVNRTQIKERKDSFQLSFLFIYFSLFFLDRQDVNDVFSLFQDIQMHYNIEKVSL